MTGVFCQSAIESAARDHDMAMQNVVTDKENFMRKFRHLFHMLDVDDTGYITLVELEERMEVLQLPKGGDLVFGAMINQDQWEWLAMYIPGGV
eukprot:symbB.v1.2.022633.t1/scaffold2022.1/size92167/1